MFRTFKLPITWLELFKRTAREASHDNLLGLAAQLAYYFLLALVPAILSVAAFITFLPSEAVQQGIEAISRFAPATLVEIIREQLRSDAAHGGLFTFGLLLSIWSSSSAIVAVCDALNRAYDIEEGRPWWRVRLTAIGLTIGLAFFIVISLLLVMVGPTVAEGIAARAGLGPAFALTWKIVQWPVVFVLIATAIGLLNYFAPDAEQDWEWITPGSLVATALWLIASLGFKLYVSNFSDYNATYGSIGGVIVLMLWFYLSGLAILIGAEINAEIEHASPYGKDVGEKVPGEKKKLGAAAAREFEEHQKERAMAPPPAPVPVPAPALQATSHKPSLLATAAAYVLIGVDLVRNARQGFPRRT